MSSWEANLGKQLDRFNVDIASLKDRQRRKVILMSDSKGRYLKAEVNKGEDIIDFIFESGARSDNKKLLEKVKSFITGLQNPVLMVWLGTCEFTKKEKDFTISLVKDRTVDEVIENLKQIKKEILKTNSSTEILFLQCPIYSIKEWNKHHGHENPDSFGGDDLILEEKVDSLNLELIALNEHSFSRPKFSLDIVRSSKVKSGATKFRKKTTYRYEDYYSDGIHPCSLLSKLWLFKLLRIADKKNQ